MLEIKVTIEAADLSKAIMELAESIRYGKTVGATPKMLVEEGDTIPADVIKTGVLQGPDGVAIDLNHAQEPEKPKQEDTATQVVAAAPEPKKAEPVIDLDAISRAGAALVDQGKMQDILNILTKYNVQAVTQLTPDQYPAFAADLRALGANI